MKLLVCGGRNYADYWTAWEVLDGIHKATPITLIIQGGALGADRFSARWAKEHGVAQTEFKAEWQKHGRAAGPIRNQRMIDEGQPDRMVAFPGGTGTAGMIVLAKTAGIPVLEIVE